MNEIIVRITDLLQEFPALRALASSMAWALAVCSGFFVFFYVIETRLGRDTARYRSRHFLNDVAYTLLYQGGIYNIVLYAPVFALITPDLDFMRLGLLASLPLPAALAVWWVSTDFLAYWLHRVQHTVPILWAFHSVHHTQTRMTFLTSNRIHLLEQFYVNLIMFTPAAVLGLPVNKWLPFYFAAMFLEVAQHAQVPWKYGWAHRIVVSPAFHGMHHSTEPEQYTGNYSKMLPVWDFIFGTYVDCTHAPKAYGVAGMDVPETLTAQFRHPFRLLFPRRSQQELPTVPQPVVVPVNASSPQMDR